MKLMPIHIASLHQQQSMGNAPPTSDLPASSTPPIASSSPPTNISSAAGISAANSTAGVVSSSMEHRLPLFSHSEFVWRYGQLAFSSVPPPYPTLDFKNHLPNSIACDPRLWNKDDVLTFLRWCELEFDLPHFDVDLFQMNGKALCLLTKQDLGERCPGAGDLIYNVLRWVIRDQSLPRSPVTPHFPLTPSWCMPISTVATSVQDYSTNSSAPQPPPPLLQNSVTLSPAPSVDSQSNSPKQLDQNTSAFSLVATAYRNGTLNSTGSSGSTHSDSDAEETSEVQSPAPIPLTPATNSPPYSPRSFSKSPSCNQIFFPPTDSSSPTTSESGTNGRLLWDFLQQLLNDSMQRYTNYITWKNRESGVFKIVDPPGLAKLWGIQKNHLSMNYDKMSRALRYYYRVNILRKVQGERHCYQFLRNPSELKSIKNISLLRQQMSPQLSPSVKTEPIDERMEDEDAGPTDLSMNQNSSKTRAVQNGKNSYRDKYHYPQDLSIIPAHLQQFTIAEARENFSRQLENRLTPSRSPAPTSMADSTDTT